MQCPPAARAPVGIMAVLLAGAAADSGAQARPDSLSDSARARLGTVTVTANRVATTSGGASAVVVRTDDLRIPAAPLLATANR